MRKILIVASLAGAVSFNLVSCKTQNVAKVATAISCSDVTPPTYTADVKTIIDANCGNSCHSASKKAHDIDLSSYENVKAVSAHPSFLGAIKHEGNYTPMPKKHPKLDDASIQKIHCWVQTGAQQ